MSDKSLEQLVNAVKSCTDFNSAADLICMLIDSPNVYSFSDILEVPLIASVNEFFCLEIV